MSKPFQRDLMEKAREKEKELAAKLDSLFKTLNAEPGPAKKCDNIVLKHGERKVAYLEVEIVGQDRWERLKTRYPTVRWPLAKKETCPEKEREDGIPVFMASVPEDLSDIAIIEARKWIEKGREEKSLFVRAGGQFFRYRKGGEEKFWAIDKNELFWGFEGLEEYLLSVLKDRNLV